MSVADKARQIPWTSRSLTLRHARTIVATHIARRPASKGGHRARVKLLGPIGKKRRAQQKKVLLSDVSDSRSRHGIEGHCYRLRIPSHGITDHIYIPSYGDKK